MSVRMLRYGLPVAVVLLAAGSLAPAVAAPTPAPVAVAATCDTSTDPRDLNGDGLTDEVATDFGATVAGKTDAGRVYVRYGTPDGGFTAPVSFAQGDAAVGQVAEKGDYFGGIVTVGWLDGDRCADLAVSAPQEDLYGAKDAGVVHVLFGAPGGLGTGRASRTLSAATDGLGGGKTVAGEEFGAALAISRFTLPEEVDRRVLAIGVPLRDTLGRKDSGAVGLVTFGDTGSVLRANTVSQSSQDFPGASEAGDQFGSALAFGDLRAGCNARWCNDLLVSAPGENGAGGIVFMLPEAGHTGRQVGFAYYQGTPGVPGRQRAGDQFGYSLAVGGDPTTGHTWAAVGVPGDDAGPVVGSGSVQLFVDPLDGNGLRAVGDPITQDTPGLAGAAENGDGFGDGLLFAADGAGPGKPVLVVGVSGESFGGLLHAGAVQVVPMVGDAPGTADALVTQDTVGVIGAAGKTEYFGFVLAEGAGGLRVGMPYDRGYEHGAVVTIPWATALGAGPNGTVWAPSSGTWFGYAIS